MPDLMDSDSAVLRAAVDTVRARASLPNTSAGAPRPGDGERTLLAKLVRSLGEAGPMSAAVFADDSELELWRKVLATIRANNGGLPSDGAHAWRTLDSQHNIMSKVLRCLCIVQADTDALNGPMPGDNERVLLWKIVRKI